jgi:hypothetical protein
MPPRSLAQAIFGFVSVGMAAILATKATAKAADPYASLGPVDGYAPYAPPSTCDPSAKPGVLAFRDWIMGRFGGVSAGIVRDCGIGSASLHHEGRAWDWTPLDDGRLSKELGDRCVAWLLAPGASGEPHALARRAGVRTIIWHRRIWTAGTQQWRQYTGSSAHTDHIHFGFGWPGANGETSLYTTDGGAVVVAVQPTHA